MAILEPFMNHVYQQLIKNLRNFKGEHGLYIIRPISIDLLINICKALDYEYKSDIAYIGKGAKTKTSDLFLRCKQEMGWANFEGATFVKKIGLYLGFDIKDKKNKELQRKTKEFICSNFKIECIKFTHDVNLLEIETQYIKALNPCLNNKKNKTMNQPTKILSN